MIIEEYAMVYATWYNKYKKQQENAMSVYVDIGDIKLFSEKLNYIIDDCDCQINQRSIYSFVENCDVFENRDGKIYINLKNTNIKKLNIRFFGELPQRILEAFKKID